MPKMNVETKDRDMPLLLLLGDNNSFIPKLLAEYTSNFKIAHITDDNATDESRNIYNIKTDNASLIKNLEEKIEYAVIYLEDDKPLKYIAPIFEKLSQDATKTVVLVNVYSIDKLSDLLLSAMENSNFYILFSGDIYSEEQNFNESSDTTRLIEDAIDNKSVTLSGNDLKPILPIYWQDAKHGINQVLLGPAKKQKLYYLFYETPQTYISAIHILERVEPDLKIVYKDNGQAQRFESVDDLERAIQGKFSTKPVYLDKYYQGFEKSIPHFINREIAPQIESRRIKRVPLKIAREQGPKIKLLTVSFLVALALFVLINAALGAGSFMLFKTSISDFKNNNYQSAASNIKTANTMLKIIDPTISLAASTITAFGYNKLESEYTEALKTADLANIASSDFAGISNITNGMDRDSLDQKIADSIFLYFNGQELSRESKIPTLNNLLTADLPKILALTQVAPQILGYDKEKKYLILFQNNGELRPTGGFIGSVGELNIKNGKIESLNLQDVYEYDGALKAHVEPYYIVRRYLQPHLYLRDSNFDPDFQVSASMSALLYSLETNKKVDGVIAVNFEAVRQIINAIGPIKLPAYDQTLDESNTFNFLEKTIDNNFFPGSTQKKDVLQALFNQIMISLENKSSEVKIASIAPNLAKEKNVLFAFNENSIQSIFSSLDFGGDYGDLRTKEDGSLNDFLGINEANIGVNKANIGVDRTTTYNVALTGAGITSTVTHVLTNRSDKDYKAYIRFMTPFGSQLTGIKIDGTQQKIVPAITDFNIYEKKGFKAPSGLEVDNFTEDLHQTFGFIVDVSSKSNQTIEVDYNNGLLVSTDPIVNYSLLLIKQPGTSSFPFTLNIGYETRFSPNKVDDATLSNGNIVMKENIDADHEFKAQLLKSQ